MNFVSCSAWGFYCMKFLLFFVIQSLFSDHFFNYLFVHFKTSSYPNREKMMSLRDIFHFSFYIAVSIPHKISLSGYANIVVFII